MLKGALLGILVLALCIGIALAGEQKGLMEKMTSPVKKLIPGQSEQAGAQKQGEGMMEKMKKMLPGEKEQAGAKKEGEGMAEKMKKLIPGKKEQAGTKKEGEGMMQKVTEPFKKIIPGGEK